MLRSGKSKDTGSEECKVSCKDINASQYNEKEDLSDRIYSLLDTAERFAIKLAAINKVMRKHRKKNKKKNKRYGKINKKSGALILKKKVKRAKQAKPLKRKQ